MTCTIGDTLFLLMFLLTLVAAYAVMVRDDCLANANAENDRLRTSLAEVIHQREEAYRVVEMKDKQIGGHLRDSVVMLHEIGQLQSGVEDVMDAGEIIGGIEAWLQEIALGGMP